MRKICIAFSSLLLSPLSHSHTDEVKKEEALADTASPAKAPEAPAKKPCDGIFWYTSVGIPGSKVSITLAPDSNSGLIRLVDISWVEENFFGWDTQKVFSYFIDEQKFYYGKPLVYIPGEACKGTGCNPLHSAKTTSSNGKSVAIDKIKASLKTAKYKGDDQKKKVEEAAHCALHLLESAR